MLCEYFGFKDEPFGATPDPRWLYRGTAHREVLASLKYAFYSNRGFSALIAPPGMGKTTLLNQFIQDIRRSARVVFIFDTQCEPLGLLRYILRDLGITPAATGDEMHEQFKEVLLKEAQAGRRVVVVVDEAQNLSDDALEMLRLLTNYETQQNKLLQVVLAGQPLLSNKLQHPSQEQLRQRISTICMIEPFTVAVTTSYIRHRLEQSGYRGAPLFRKDALKLITQASHGIPRIINTLCFNSLSLCLAVKSKQVDSSMVAEVIADLELDPQMRASFESPEEVAAEELQQPERTRRITGTVKLLVSAAAVVLVVIGLGLLSHYVQWQSLHRSANSSHSTAAKASLTLNPAQTAVDRGGNIGAVPSAKTTPSDTTILSASGSASTAAIADHTSIKEPSSKDKPFQIEVQSNQTLQNISLYYLGTWDLRHMKQIQALNPNLTDPNHIEAGQKIWLPASELALTAPNPTFQANGREHHEP